MKIAVIIVNYNSGAILAECLEHLSRQVRKPDAILVVDNASEDESLAAAKNDPSVETLQLDSNLGFAAANNLGFKQLEGVDYFVTLNPDAFPEPGFVQSLERAANKHPQYSSYACRMMADEQRLDGAGDIYHISGLAWRRGHNKLYDPANQWSQTIFSPCAGAAMYKASDILGLGGFDESFFCYMEDVDLGYRLLLQDKKCLYVPEATVLHLGSAISNQYPDFADYHGHRNLVWVILKNTPLPLLLLALPAHLLMTLVMALEFVRLGKLRVFLKSKRDALAATAYILEKRREIQKNKKLGSWDVLKKLSFQLWR